MTGHLQSGVRIAGTAQLPMRTRIPEATYPELLAAVSYAALADAGLEADDIDAVVLALGPSPLLGVDRTEFWGASGLPGADRLVARVHTAAASGLSAVRLAFARVAAGQSRRVLVAAADLADEAGDLARAVWQLLDPLTERRLPVNGITMAALQTSAYMARWGHREADLALVAVKNRANGCHNEFAQLRKPVTVDDVLSSRALAWPIRLLDGSPRSSGAAAVIVAAEDALPAGANAVSICGLGANANRYAMAARLVPQDDSYVTGSDLAQAARQAYAMAGIERPAEQIDMAEIYASFGVIELLSAEALGLAEPGGAVARLRDGDFERDGALPINPSGGATCGNPISATGLIRVAEAAAQLRSAAGERQVKRAATAVVSAVGGAFQLHEVAVLAA